jgi:hypothetical protein
MDGGEAGGQQVMVILDVIGLVILDLDAETETSWYQPCQRLESPHVVMATFRRRVVQA